MSDPVIWVYTGKVSESRYIPKECAWAVQPAAAGRTLQVLFSRAQGLKVVSKGLCEYKVAQSIL